MSLASGIWLQGVLKVLKSCIASMYGVFTYISHIYIYVFIYRPYMDATVNACFSQQFDFDDNASVSFKKSFCFWDWIAAPCNKIAKHPPHQSTPQVIHLFQL